VGKVDGVGVIPDMGSIMESFEQERSYVGG
jgi:hypothetical protein